MAIIAVFLYVFFVLSALLLIFLVLIQDEQGEGLGGIFGGGSSTPFGSRSGNVLTKATTIVGTVFLVCSLGLAWINRTPDSDSVIQAARKSGGSQETFQWWNETPGASSGTAAGTETTGTDAANTGDQPSQPSGNE